MDTHRQDLPVFKYRRFGPVGPVYEVLGVRTDLPDGDRLLRVRIVASGEEADYRLSHALEDPEAD